MKRIFFSFFGMIVFFFILAYSFLYIIDPAHKNGVTSPTDIVIFVGFIGSIFAFSGFITQLGISIIRYRLDRIFKKSYKLKPRGVRISSLDPFGEENWEEYEKV